MNKEYEMKNGIYSLIFKSEGKDFGNGILVVADERALGGDLIYVYKGEVEGNTLVLELTQHNQHAHSIFGNLNALKVNLNLYSESNGYILKGNVENLQTVPLIVDAKFIGDLS